MNIMNPNVMERHITLFGFSIAWVFLGKTYDLPYKVICKIPFGTDLYLIKKIG